MSYSFLRESKLYIVYNGVKYRIYTSSAITFNQTFAESSYSVKTLHDQSKMFEQSIINKANPASFSFDVSFTCLQSCNPSTFGIIKAEITQSGDRLEISSNAVALLLVEETSHPSSSSNFVITLITTGSSSTIKMLVFLDFIGVSKFLKSFIKCNTTHISAEYAT